MPIHIRPLLLALSLTFMTAACTPRGHVSIPTFESDQYTFSTPEQAVGMLKDALNKGDTSTLAKIFGPQSSDLLSSGDAVADQQSFQTFAQRIDEGVEIVQTENQNPAFKNQQLAFLYIGHPPYPFPIALQKRANGWRFDTSVGKEELLNRRIGRNELRAIDAMQQIVRAQWRYYEQQVHEGRPQEYAKHFVSSADTRGGIYWENTGAGKKPPLDPTLTATNADGKPLTQLKSSRAYYGYHFVILKKQGTNARGGSMSYIDNQGRMSKGFGLLAYPTRYGKSGVVTFITGPDGVIYQKNLGPETERVARSMIQVNPDLSWIPVR
jgi:hypothetical protein